MLLVFCQKVTSRIDYIFSHVFFQALNFPFRFTNDISTFVAHNGPKMSYGTKPLGNEFFIEAVPLLFEQGLQDVSIQVKKWKTHQCFFESSKDASFPFDVFAASFYLISRYEEYLPHVKDEHGRFQSKQSLAQQYQFISTPLIDLWIEELRLALIKDYPVLENKTNSSPEFMPLVEVVTPYKYLHKSVFRNTVQWLKAVFQLNLWEMVEHPLVLMGIRKDPWDTFDTLISLFSKKSFSIKVFFLFSKESYVDRGISPLNTSFQILIKKVADYFSVSLLASHATASSAKQLGKERSNLSKLIHRPVDELRYAGGVTTAMDSYGNLLAQEIKSDFSLSYPNIIGYRASTAVPFYLYDLSNEIATNLKVFPVVANERYLSQNNPNVCLSNLEELRNKLPLSTCVHCFVLSNKILENSEDNKEKRNAYISYLKTHDKKG